MKKIILLLSIIAFSFSACRQAGEAIKLTYPTTKKAEVTDNYFGTKVPDPYRWLENDTAEEVMNWVKDENKVTQDYLAKIPFRSALHKRLEEIWNFPRYTAPFRKGTHYYFYKNNGLQNQSVLYRMEGLNGTPKEFFDPNKLSTDGTVSLAGQSFSKDGKYWGYIISRAGSDWEEIHVLDATTGKKLTDSIAWVKFSGISWKDDGFYYSRYDEPKKGKNLSGVNQFQKIYYHKVGTPQSIDALVYEDKKHGQWGFGAETSEDEKYLYVYATEGASSGNHLYMKDLSDPKSTFVKLFDGFDCEYGIIDQAGDKIYVKTNRHAGKFRLVEIDTKDTAETNWKNVIPEKEEVLQSTSVAGGKVFAIYMKDAYSHVYRYSRDGIMEQEIKLPTIGTASGFGGEKEDSTVFYTFSSFTYPSTVFMYHLKNGQSTLYRKSEIKFNPEDYEVQQVKYKSKDGTQIPMFIVHKKGIKMDGMNPTFLYGYGGFDISLNPDFSVSRLIFLEQGGVYAVPSLRGGGEYGVKWHKAGMLGNKQNVFDDFIAAAQYLIDNKYTSPEKLAIHGRSNGGLLIGACMTQRPEMFKVALPGVGVLDMLRYHKFTIGHAWANEYGAADSTKEQFAWLYKYSPLHNLKKGTAYPATLITTADHDDRVVPAHSFKYAAALQEANDGTNPILIRIDSKAGHGSGKPTSKQIDEWADIWSFVFYNLGVSVDFE